MKKLLMLWLASFYILSGCQVAETWTESKICKILDYQIMDYGVNVFYDYDDQIICEFIEDDRVYKCDESSRMILIILADSFGIRRITDRYLYFNEEDYLEFFRIRYGNDVLSEE